MRTRPGPDTIVLAGCIALGLLLRLAYAIIVPAETWGDTPRYDWVGVYWAEGGAPWTPGSPLDLRAGVTYPAFLAFVYSTISHTAKAVVAFQHALGLLLIPLTFSLARCAFSLPVAGLAAALVAIDPVLIRYEHRAMTEIPSTFFILLFVWLLIRALRPPSKRLLAVAGVTLGLGILARPVLQFLALAAPVVLLIAAAPQFSRMGARRAARDIILSVLVFFVATAAVVAPWIIRNRVVYGFTGISAISGQLLKKTRPFGEVEGNYPQIRKLLKTEGVDIQNYMLNDGYDWLEYDQIFQAIAMEDLKKHPGAFLDASADTAGRMWKRNDFSLASQSYRKTPEFAKNRSAWAQYQDSFPRMEKDLVDRYVWPYVPLLTILGSALFAVFPLLVWLRNPRRRLAASESVAVRVALLLPVAYVALTGALLSDTGNPRYRSVVDPLIFIFTAATVISAARLVWFGITMLRGRDRAVSPLPEATPQRGS